jgi:LPXTG-site transpeptidase (sortase) family protein
MQLRTVWRKIKSLSRAWRRPRSLRSAWIFTITFLVLSGVFFLLANAEYFYKRLKVARLAATEPASTLNAAPRASKDEQLLALLDQPDRLAIPRLLIEAPIVRATERNEQSYQTALRNGVVHFPGTAEAGEPGNAYYFGHSSDFPLSPGDYKTVFAALTDVQIGDAIYITDERGNAYRYAVTGTRVVEPDDLSVLDQGDKTKRTLTLQTSYPIGTALRRFLVIAELADGLLVR